MNPLRSLIRLVANEATRLDFLDLKSQISNLRSAGLSLFLLAVAILPPCASFAAAPTKPFELREGDRVVFLGDTLMEREKDFGYIELMMTLRFPDRNVTFRNLGWSADTPVGLSRVSFDWPKGEGEMFRVLMEQVRQVQPTVVVLGSGMASSLEDAAATEMERQSKTESPLTPALSPLRGE